jgi:hypothetical protein
MTLFSRTSRTGSISSRAKAASEAEGTAHADANIAQFEAHGEAPPADRNGMFRLMMDRLSDLQHDIAAHEFSERPMLLGIALEKHMQVWFAKRLQERENGAYRVDSEALVINDKETDIRLLSVRSNAQAVIEIKLPTTAIRSPIWRRRSRSNWSASTCSTTTAGLDACL